MRIGRSLVSRCALLGAALLLLTASSVAAQPARDDWRLPGGLVVILPPEVLCPPSQGQINNQPDVPRWATGTQFASDTPYGAPRRIKDDPLPSVTTPFVAVLDEGSGALLYASYAHQPLPPASVTKIMTTIVAIERGGDLSRQVTTEFSASQMVARDGSSVMGMEPGERVRLLTLLYGMMLPSANDGAEQVARSLGGTRERYVGWMNAKARELGLRNTRFRNPSGMDEIGHCASAYDLAVLSRYAMQDATFRQIVATPYLFVEDYGLRNLNPLINSYEGADGVKIGYTDGAGRTIVGSATRNGHRVYVSVLRSTNTRGDSAALLNWVWDNFAWE